MNVADVWDRVNTSHTTYSDDGWAQIRLIQTGNCRGICSRQTIRSDTWTVRFEYIADAKIFFGLAIRSEEGDNLLRYEGDFGKEHVVWHVFESYDIGQERFWYLSPSLWPGSQQRSSAINLRKPKSEFLSITFQQIEGSIYITHFQEAELYPHQAIYHTNQGHDAPIHGKITGRKIYELSPYFGINFGINFVRPSKTTCRVQIT